MSVKKIKTPSGEIKWEVRVYENGRGSKRLCEKFDRKVDADTWLLEFDKNKSERLINPFAGVSFKDRFFKEEAEHWLEDSRHRFSAGHQVKARAIITEILKHLGDFAIQKITPDFLMRFQQMQLKQELSPSTVNRKTEVITAILNFSVKQRRIPFNPANGFRKLRKVQKEMSFWNIEEARSFLTYASEKYPPSSKQRWIYVVYLLALNTGLRAGEVWGLRPADIQRQNFILSIKRQFNRISLSMSLPKSKKPRVVPCNQNLMDELLTLIQNHQIKDHETIFQNEKRLPICHDNFADRNFMKDLNSWGGRKIRFHDLRHTATTLLISNNVDIKTVKEICGHADITTTMNYVHLMSGAIENVAKTFSIAATQMTIAGTGSQHMEKMSGGETKI